MYYKKLYFFQNKFIYLLGQKLLIAICLSLRIYIPIDLSSVYINEPIIMRTSSLNLICAAFTSL